MLIIVGSRREGNSYKLAQKIKEKLDIERIHTDIIIPGNQKIHLCTGCMDCDKDGICDFKDDMEENIKKIRGENILMFITPTRWNLLSGDLKIFIDRLNPMYSRGELKGKKMISVSIGSKGKEKYSTTSALSSLLSFAESAGIEPVLNIEFNDCLNDSDILFQSAKIDDFIGDLKTIITK